MRKSYGALTFVAAVLIPLVPFIYLFRQNSLYLDAGQGLLVIGGLIVLGCLGFGVLKVLFKANTAVLAGCVIAWTAFYAFSFSCDWAHYIGLTIYKIIAIYGALTIALTLLVGFMLRKVRNDGWIPIFTIFLCVMLLINGVPAGIQSLQSEKAKSEFDKSILKLDFLVDETTPSPNVYWFHCDGMLGLGAMEKYFQDSQTSFKEELTKRGFLYNENAMLESGHTTQMAVAVLMCPYYCDTALKEVTRDHEAAMRVKANNVFLKGELLTARIYNETVCAFRQKGYQANMVVDFGKWFTPLADRDYCIGGASDKELVFDVEGTDEQILDTYMTLNDWNEMAQLLLGRVGRLYVRKQIPAKALSQEIDPDIIKDMLINTQGKSETVNLVRCLYDSFASKEPVLRVIDYSLCHEPFDFTENGDMINGDHNDPRNYGTDHTYATKVLIRLLDMILAQDPDAVIVLQADHGLHSLSKERIAATFGAGTEIDIWNSVMSAIRVPEKYKTVDLEKTMDTPLNMARYLVNSYVGGNYAYYDLDGTAA